MPINNKSVIALIASAVLLVATAAVLYAYQFGLFTKKIPIERVNHSEVRAAWDMSTRDLTNR